MNLVEPLDRINHLLQREYGVHEDGRPKFRVVWSDDQFEKRWVFHTKEGFELLSPEVKQMPKYMDERCKHRYILEQLSIVPETDRELVEKLSYEPLWVFRDRFDNYLPPRFDASKIIIDHMYLNMSVVKPPKKEDSEDVIRARQKELDDVEEKLFGNETPLGDGMQYGWATSVPGHDDQTKLGGRPSKAEQEKIN